MKLLKRVQSLPEKKRKIILWGIVAVLATLLLFWWTNNFQKRLAGFEGSQFLEKLNLPEVETPELPTEELEELKEGLKNIEANVQ